MLTLSLAVGCSSDEDPDQLPAISDNVEDAPSNPELCEPACEALTGSCGLATELDDESQTDVELMRTCMTQCHTGAFSDAELECLASAECAESGACLE